MKIDHQSLNTLLFHKTRQKQGVTPEKVITESSPSASVSSAMVVVARGEPGTPFELVDTNRLWVIKRKGTTQAVANLKEASILTEFVRFIRGRHRRTETPVGARDRLLALFDRGRDAQAQNKKVPYKDQSRYELRHLRLF